MSATHPPITKDEADLLAAYHSAPRPVRDVVQIQAYICAGRPVTPAMAHHLEVLSALVLAASVDGRAAA